LKSSRKFCNKIKNLGQAVVNQLDQAMIIAQEILALGPRHPP
jgi:hypothetical protein